MTFGRYLLGIALLAATTVPLAFGAGAARRRLMPEAAGATAALATAVLTTGTLLAVAELLGLVGLLDAVALVIGALAAAAVLLRVGARGGPRPAPVAAPAAPAPARALTLLAAAAGALTLAAWLRRTLEALDLGMGGVDSLWYHMPFAARFAQTGSIAHAQFVDLQFLTAWYPANSELAHAVGMVLFGTDAISPLLNLAWLALALLAAWCVGRSHGAGPVTLSAGALVLGLPTLVESQAGEAKNDVFGLAFVLAAAALLVETRRRPGALAVAGLAAGLAAGTKVSLVLPVVALTVAAVAVAPPARRRAGAGAWVAGLVVGGGVWYARNLALVGNPLPWVHLGPLPNPADPLNAGDAHAVSRYLLDGDVWSAWFLPGLHHTLGHAWPAVLAVAAAGAALAIARPAGREVRALGLVALAAVLAYVVTPATAAGPVGRPIGFELNVRYLAPALALGACLLPLAPPLRRGRAPALLATALLALLVAGQATTRVWPADHVAAAVLVALAAGGALVGLGAPPRARRAPPVALAGLAAVALVAGAALAWRSERVYLRDGYTRADAPFTSWADFGLTPAYQGVRRVGRLRIALTGTSAAFFQYPLYGPRHRNRVQVLGRHGPHGSFTPLRACPELRRAVTAGRYEAVITTPRLDIWSPYRPLPTPEPRWLTGDPHATRVLSSGDVRIYRITGPLNPARCPR